MATRINAYASTPCQFWFVFYIFGGVAYAPGFGSFIEASRYAYYLHSMKVRFSLHHSEEV